MLIGVRKRFVFIANSKTASTSIEKRLTPYAEINRVGSPQRKHIPWTETLQEYSFLFGRPEHAPEKFFKFGVIREPLDWVRSWFNYRLNNPEVEHPLPPHADFSEWWRNENDWVKNLSQAQHFTNSEGRCAMDALIPLDTLAEALPAILNRLGVPASPLPIENKSPGQFGLSQIPDRLAEEIRAHYAQDVSLYAFWKRHWREALSGNDIKRGITPQ